MNLKMSTISPKMSTISPKMSMITINDMQVKSSFSRATVVRILNKLKRKNVISYIGTSKKWRMDFK